MAKNRVRAKDIKKQRWAGIIAAVLAVAMIASLAGVYLAQRAGSRSEPVPDQQGELQPDDYVAHYQEEIERLEQYLEEHEPTEAVLVELGENYRYLIFIQEIFFEDVEAVEEYRSRLVSIYEQLTEMDQDNLFYRLELAYLLVESGDEEMADREIETIREMLRENADARVHLSLIGLLSSTGREQIMEEEIEWLKSYLESEISAGKAGNEELFYYAVLNGEYLGRESEAEAILEDILAQESEESSLYQEAANYLERLTGDGSAEDASTD